ncbi:nuclear transport factor 2 family protein [Mycobacterium sp. DL592]|uniref:nuclear transport factor 2 family protein n=1 Tax=Mycobacterium sp. DL592 TaxID=2675524 RepID=UPI0014206400|nr:nuclear transport factor 2 family protein [Mycobacterium sp. DL592]
MTGAPVTLSPVERLLAIEEINAVFAGRLHCLDAKDWEHYGDFHTEDVVSDTWRDARRAGDTPAPVVVGREALSTAIRATLDGPVPITSVHHGHTPLIELTTDTTARGVWAMEDRLWWTHGETEEHLHGWGHYHETYRKVDGRWLISSRTLTRIRVDVTPGFLDRPNR